MSTASDRAERLRRQLPPRRSATPDPAPAPPTPADLREARALVLFRQWREALELGAHTKAETALQRLRQLAIHPDPGSRWDFQAKERRKL
jgi:hypothetical protein